MAGVGTAIGRVVRQAAVGWAIVAGSLLAAQNVAAAQNAAVGVPAGPTAATATRAQLTAAAADAERRGDRRTATDYRARLSEGDFQVGDQLQITFTLDTTHQQTFAVRDSQRVDILPLGSLSLRGVLRSELLPTVQRFYGQYYRNPEVRVQPLIRVGFLGAVQKPGYYNVAPDTPVADAFTQNAGGPSPAANLKKIEVKRGSERVLDRGAYEHAARDGLTFDQVAMRSGDELRIPEQRRTNRLQSIRIFTISLGIILSILALIRSANNY